MPRQPYADMSEVAPEFRQMVEDDPNLHINILKMWAHAPATIRLAALWGKAQFTSLSLSAVDRELITLVTAAHNRSTYEIVHHLTVALALGCTAQQVDAVLQPNLQSEWFLGDAASKIFSDEQRALLRFTAETCRSPTVDDAIFAEVTKFYTQRQIVECLTLHGWYYMIGRITTVMQIESDESLDGLDVQRALANTK